MIALRFQTVPFGWACLVLVALVANRVSMVNAQQTEPSAEKVQKLIVVTGAPGEDEYGQQFATWAQRWAQLAAADKTLEYLRLGAEPADQSDRELLQQAISNVDERVERLWLVLIGHGTDDRESSKFNLIGPDVSAVELDQWLDQVDCQVVVINCASASGGFIGKLKAVRRIVITATKSGAQYNFARFGDYLSQAISDPSLDLDKDQQTSLFEAFVAASRNTLDYYDREKRLPSELALLDDNGDGLGTPGDWFVGTRTDKETKSGQVDGQVASGIVLFRRGVAAKLTPEQRQQRDQIEAQIETLRQRKATLEEDEYYAKLEAFMLELARLYETVETVSPEQDATPSDESLSENDS